MQATMTMNPGTMNPGAMTPDFAQERTAPKAGRKARGGWVWIPLSFIFLLLGTVLGFQVALSVRSQIPHALREDPYVLNLSVTPAGESLHVRWDRHAPAIQGALRGALIITEGGQQKTVPLQIAELQNGSVIYRRASSEVRFRLDVVEREQNIVSETLQFNAEPSAPPAPQATK